MKLLSIYDISLTAIFTAIIAVISQFSIITPFGVPLSFQVFAIALAGYLLKPRFSFYSVLCYILLGLVGLPIFSGFIGGPQHILGPTGGFILGFLVLVVFCGISANGKNRIVYSLIGLLFCHIIGIIQFSVVTKTNVFISAVTVSVPFFLKDFILLVLANILSKRIVNIINKIR